MGPLRGQSREKLSAGEKGSHVRKGHQAGAGKEEHGVSPKPSTTHQLKGFNGARAQGQSRGLAWSVWLPQVNYSFQPLQGKPPRSLISGEVKMTPGEM